MALKEIILPQTGQSIPPFAKMEIFGVAGSLFFTVFSVAFGKHIVCIMFYPSTYSYEN